MDHRTGLVKCLTRIQSIEKLTSTQDVHRVNTIIEDVLLCLPGPSTPEKLCRYDYDTSTNWSEVAENEYAQILNEVIRLFDSCWPLYMQEDNNSWKIEQNVVNLFSMDHSAHFVVESVSSIFAKGNAPKFNVLAKIFESCMRIECWLPSALIDYCYIEETESQVKSHHDQEEFIQLLIAAPSKVANYFSGQHSSNLFDSEHYSCVLSTAIIKAIYFIAEIHRVEQTKMFHTDFLGQLFGRIAVDFNLNRMSTILPKIFHIFSLTAATTKCTELKASVQEMFLNLHRNSLNTVAWYLLNTDHPVDVLGKAAQLSKDWEFVLKTKLPLTLSSTDEKFIKNLITCLLNTLPKVEYFDVLQDVLKAWSSKASVNSNSLEQQVYLAKFIVLGVGWFGVHENVSASHQIATLIHNGVQNHMMSLNPTIRAIGMITGEIVLNALGSGNDEQKLRFDFNDFSDDIVKIVDEIRKFGEQATVDVQFDEGKLNTLILELYDIINEVHTVNSTTKTHTRPSIVQNASIEIGSLSVSSANSAKILATPKPTNIEELDSDDDDELQAYDMSNDEPQIQEKAPKYLQDLRDALVETEDSDVFEQSMTTCAKLINERLPSDITDVGLELLKVLIALEQRFYMESNFHEHRMAACIAIGCVQPKKFAEYLCKEIHAECGRHSIAQKVLMMEILSETAKALSKLKVEGDDEMNKPTDSNKMKKLIDKNDDRRQRILEIQRIIRERIDKKTRRFAHSSFRNIESGQVNRFASVAGSFIFPLLYGFGKEQLTLYGMKNSLKHDADNILLLNFLGTVATITLASIHCPIIPKITQEVFQLALVLRFHAEPKIRLAVLQVIAAALMATPKVVLQTHFSNYLAEFQSWLEELLSVNITKGEMVAECRELAKNVLALCIDSITM